VTIPSLVLPEAQARAWVETVGLRIETFDAGFLPLLTDSYRFFTATLLHRSVNHLIGNIFMMHMFSQETERDMGSKRFLAVFMGGSIVAFLTQIFFRFNAGTLQMGASGGIAAAMGAFLADCPGNRQ